MEDQELEDTLRFNKINKDETISFNEEEDGSVVEDNFEERLEGHKHREQEQKEEEPIEQGIVEEPLEHALYEWVGSITEEMSASTDHEKTACLRDNITGCKDDADLSWKNDGGCTSGIDDAFSETDETISFNEEEDGSVVENNVEERLEGNKNKAQEQKEEEQEEPIEQGIVEEPQGQALYEWVGSITEEMSARSDHEKTACLRDNITGCKDDADLSKNDGGCTSGVDDAFSKTDETISFNEEEDGSVVENNVEERLEGNKNKAQEQKEEEQEEPIEQGIVEEPLGQALYEWVGSITEEMSASSDHEKTACLKDNMTSCKDDADLSSKNDGGCTSGIDDAFSETDEISLSIDENLKGPQRQISSDYEEATKKDMEPQFKENEGDSNDDDSGTVAENCQTSPCKTVALKDEIQSNYNERALRFRKDAMLPDFNQITEEDGEKIDVVDKNEKGEADKNSESAKDYSQLSDIGTLTPRNGSNFNLNERTMDRLEEAALFENNNVHSEAYNEDYTVFSETEGALHNDSEVGEANTNTEGCLDQGDDNVRLQDPEQQSQLKELQLYDSPVHAKGDASLLEEHRKKLNDTEGGSYFENDLPLVAGDESIPGGFCSDDDLSSIFSDDSQDMNTLLQQNSTLREAMMQLRNDNPEVFTDTVSETSDEIDNFYHNPCENSVNGKLLRSQLTADSDLNAERLNELMREKRESQAKLRQLEREKAAAERKNRQDKMDRDFLEERFSIKAAQFEKEIHNLKQENQRLRRASPREKGKNASDLNKSFGDTKDTTDPFVANEDRSLEGRKGFAIDIAMLARENEKLSEIIDHLQESPGNDCFSEFVDNLDRYVPKGEYIRIENEKLKLETTVREKERLIKEQERLLEETKFDLEEEIEILKENLRKAEIKNIEKGKVLRQSDIKMMESKAKFTEKVRKLESKLEEESANKMKLETVIVNLKKCNERFHSEIQNMKDRMKKLQKQGVENEENNRRNKFEAEERLRQEAEEKAKLGRNVEALLQDLMQLKSKMLEEGENHRQEKEKLRSELENEKMKWIDGHKNEHRSLISELDVEKRKNEQLKRMVEIPMETIVPYVENTTEDGAFESPMFDIEQGIVEKSFPDERLEDQGKDDTVMTFNNNADNGSWNANSGVEDNTRDLPKLKRKLVELARLNGNLKRRNKESEEENIHLKERMETVGRDVSRLRELEGKNEELQEEISRNVKKKIELQRKQEDLTEEMEEILKKLSKVERNNEDLLEEVSRLTKKIKTMETESTEERLKLASTLEQEKKIAVNEKEKLLEDQKVKSKDLENLIHELNADIQTVKEAKRTAEENFVNDMRNLVEKHNTELANERERHRQLQDELNNNAGTVRRVTEEWEQMLRKTVNRYEEDLQKGEQEKRKMADGFQRQKNEMKSKFDKERETLKERIQGIESGGRSPLEREIAQETIELSFGSPDNEEMEEVNSEMGEEERNSVIAKKNEKIRTLDGQRQRLKQKLEQLTRSHEEEKSILCDNYKQEKQKLEETLTDHYKRIIAEGKHYYEGLLQDQKRKYETENEEIENRFKRERREYEERLKQDFANNLSSKSTELQTKIEADRSEKVLKQKEIIQRLEAQMREKVKVMQNEKNENQRKFEREKQVLEATIQALSKELEKAKQEAKDLKKKQKKHKAEMEETFENEKKEMTEAWERCKLDTINQIEEEWSEKLKNELNKSEVFREELQETYEARIKQMKVNFKAQKADMEGRLADAISELNSLAESKKEIRAALEDEYKKKLQKEKENIESTLQGLHHEIGRLQEHRKQLQNQMAQRESHAKANVAPLLDNNPQVLTKLSSEHQEKMKREKEYHESKMRDLHTEIEKLHDDLSNMKAKARQEKIRVKADFEKEREQMEEQFEKERREWQTRMNMISAMQPARDRQRVGNKISHINFEVPIVVFTFKHAINGSNYFSMKTRNSRSITQHPRRQCIRMENSSVQNEETGLTVNVEGQSQKQTEESYRQEIEDIVHGFIIEKDILAQSHEEEIRRMKQHFDLEKRQLLQQLETDKEQMIAASRIRETATTANAEVYFAQPEALISNAGQSQSLSEALTNCRLRSSFHRRSNSGHDIDEVDSSLIREIAEVYLRINNGALTSQMRPELDLEDKYEREKEVLERSFQLEKRELKRKLEDESHQKMEQDRMKYEATTADLKTTISELQWQKREADNRLQHEKEKWEMTVEREKNEIEKRHLQFIHDTRRKLEDKHSRELEKQRIKYEENISDLQTDISKLTMQLRELNENLSYEKEIIVSKFDRDVKEMEQAFLEQRSSLKGNMEAEFLVRLEHETSLLKAINGKLKEDLEHMEKEKKDAEKRGKEESRKLEERFEEEITEIEQRQSEEKRALKIKLEEKYQLELARQTGDLEETIKELSDEIVLLKEENVEMEINFAERRSELQRLLEMEKEGIQRKIDNEREEMRFRVEKDISERLMLEKPTQSESLQHHERDMLMIQAKYEELQMQMTAMRQEREMLLRDKAHLEGNLKKSNEKRAIEMYDGTGNPEGVQDGGVRINEMLREKDKELAGIKFENQRLELALSAKSREKSDLEDEITNLRRRLSSNAEDFGGIRRTDSELTFEQEVMNRKEGEVATLQKEKKDLASRLSSLQHKNDELEDELASLRRKKLEVEDEISALKRDKTDSDNQVASLKKDKAELEELITQLKRRREQLEHSISKLKRVNVELEREISNLKMQNSTLEIEVHRQFDDQLENGSQSVLNKQITQDSILPGVTRESNDSRVLEIYFERQDASVLDEFKDINDSELKRNAKTMQRMISDLKRERDVLVSEVRRLSDEKRGLDNGLRIQLENQREGTKAKDKRDATRALQKQQDDLEKKIASLKETEEDLKGKVSQHKRELSVLVGKVNESRDNQLRLQKEMNTVNYENHNLKNATLGKKNAEEKQKDSPRRGIDGNKVGKSADEEIFVLRRERDALQRELTHFKEEFVLIQKELSMKTIHSNEKSFEINEREISELKLTRAELEREMSVLMTNKTQLEAEISDAQDCVKQEEIKLNNLKRDRTDLELRITTLQSQNTRLKAEGSVLNDERHKDENEVERLRKEKAELKKDVFSLQIKMLQSENTPLDVNGAGSRDEQRSLYNNMERVRSEEYTLSLQNDTGILEVEERDRNEVGKLMKVRDELEKDVFSLQNEKGRLEAEISVVYVAWETKTIEIANLQRNLQEMTDHMELLKKQKEYMQSEIIELRSTEELDHAEFQELHRGKSAIEIQLMGLRTYGDNETRPAAGNIEIQKLKNHEESELENLRKQKSELEINIGDLQRKKHDMENLTLTPEQYEVRKEEDQSYFTDYRKEHFGDSEYLRCETQQELNTSHQDSGSYDRYYNLESSMNNYNSKEGCSQSSQVLATSTPLKSPGNADDVKDDNHITSLKRERSELESQIYDMQMQLEQLHTEVTGLENRKTILEAIHGAYSPVEMRTEMMNGYDLSVGVDLDLSTPRTITEDKKDNLIREYEDQIQGLKHTKVELEQKESLLEWQLENMKQKLDIQEICHRREISTLNEKNLSFNGFHGNIRDDSLQEFYQKLSYFLTSGEHSNKEIMEEIERQISNLQLKEYVDKKDAKDDLTSQTVNLERDRSLPKNKTTLAKQYAKQLKTQMDTAENQLKSCEKVIHRLYGENTDLAKQNQNLEGKLKSAAHSQETLQRKKVLLQKLVEKLSSHMGKDAIQQSYLVFELDKGVSI
ncbi:golgin subfamily A member 4-like [Montipora capricornis]|uniref:golgin subfamily A member 4-like n=1 Tax=Montipora capricornis TaxID=246305 RepID=UPI0035F1FA6C